MTRHAFLSVAPALTRAGAAAVLVLAGACAGIGTADGPSRGPDARPALGIEPTMRNPSGYTGRPVDSSPTTSELEGDRGLPRSGEVIGSGRRDAGVAADLPAVPPLPADGREETAVE